MAFSRTLRKIRRRVQNESRRETIDLREEDLYEILADSRRRAVIKHLADADRHPPTCAELAVAIAADETHMDHAVVPPRRVQPVEDDLRTEHLPRLAESGLVQWDGGADAVRPGHSVEPVAQLVDEMNHRVQRERALPSSPWQTSEPGALNQSQDSANRPTISDGGRPPR